MTSRTRSRGSKSFVQPFTEEQNYFNCTQNSWVLGTNFTNPLWVGTQETMTDEIVPGFRHKQAKGEVFFNPMTRSVVTQAWSPTSEYLFRAKTQSCASPPKYAESRGWLNSGMLGVPRSASGDIAVTGVYSANETNNLVTEVCTGALAKRGHADSNLFESIAEIDQTLDLLRKPLKTLYGIYERIRKDKAKLLLLTEMSSNAYKVLDPRFLSGGYLAYRYGLRPAIQDVQTVLKGLHKSVGKMRITSRSSSSLRGTNVTTSYPIVGGLKFTTETSITDDIVCRAMSLNEVDVGILHNLGFTAKGLITLPWELTTLSFVADWFVNIGDYLNALAPSLGWKELGNCYTLKREISVIHNVYDNTNLVSGTHNLLSKATGVASVYQLTKSRARIVSPGIVVRSGFGFDKATRVGDAFALLAQRFVGLERELRNLKLRVKSK